MELLARLSVVHVNNAYLKQDFEPPITPSFSYLQFDNTEFVIFHLLLVSNRRRLRVSPIGRVQLPFNPAILQYGGGLGKLGVVGAGVLYENRDELRINKLRFCLIWTWTTTCRRRGG